MQKILVENIIHRSHFLNRDVQVDCYLPKHHFDSPDLRLLLINDGQNLAELDLARMLQKLYDDDKLQPLLCVGLGAGVERRNEYGVSSQPDYLGRGAKAPLYTAFVMKELLPCLCMKYPNLKATEVGFAGFSLGGLMALDIVWNYPERFSTAGIFSGSLWWRSLDDKDEAYQDEQHRIMHQLIKSGRFQKGLKFFSQPAHSMKRMTEIKTV